LELAEPFKFTDLLPVSLRRDLVIGRLQLD
jgi:hypothetical protein